MGNKYLKTALSFLIIFGTASLMIACSDQPTNATSGKLNASDQNITKTNEFKPILEQRVQSGESIGIAIGVIDNESQTFINVGLADKNSGQKITKDSLFEIGSITKTFTTLILADMVIKGEINLDDPVSKFLPQTVTMPSFEGQDITLKHLATHTSALPRMPDNFAPADLNNPYADYTPELMYAFLSSYTLERPLDEAPDYSNLGMGLLGHILERHSGMSYEELVTSRILTPLGMKDTFITIPENKRSLFTTGHNAEGLPTSHWEWDIPTLSGAGALRSSSSDMMLYLKANMGLTDTPLSAAMELSHKFQYKAGPDGAYIGLAWFTQKMDDQSVTWHNGGTGGYKSFLGFDKESKKGVIVLANAQDNPDKIGRALLTNTPEMLVASKEDSNINFTGDELDQFVGKYQLTPNFVITITRTDAKLFAQATGQSKFPIFAKSRTEFFYKVVDASLIFAKNDKGEIASLILDQNGRKQPAPKIIQDEPVISVTPEIISLTPEELDRFVGKYQLAPKFVITITRKGTSLFSKATGQPKFPIFAKSKTEFFYKVVDASLVFVENDKGEITSLILDQNGQKHPAPKR